MGSYEWAVMGVQSRAVLPQVTKHCVIFLVKYLINPLEPYKPSVLIVDHILAQPLFDHHLFSTGPEMLILKVNTREIF